MTCQVHSRLAPKLVVATLGIAQIFAWLAQAVANREPRKGTDAHRSIVPGDSGARDTPSRHQLDPEGDWGLGGCRASVLPRIPDGLPSHVGALVRRAAQSAMKAKHSSLVVDIAWP